MDAIEPVPPAEPPTPSSEERNWAVAAHIAPAVAWLFGSWLLNIVAPLVVYVVKRDSSAFARGQAAEALNFQISLTIYFVVGLVLSIVTLGLGLLVFIPLVLVGLVASVVLGVIAALRVSRGEPYRYPLTIRLLS